MKECEKNRLARLLAILSLGIAKAIKEDLLTLDEAERLLFSPGTMRLLEEAGMQTSAVSVIHAGTELDDIRRLVPAHLAPALERLECEAASLLLNTKQADPELDNWLKDVLRHETTAPQAEARTETT